jgi:hypothetical protein
VLLWPRTFWETFGADDGTLQEASCLMPLYTYVIAYRGAVHTAQTRRSNPSGFAVWLETLPPLLRKQVRNPHTGFEPIPNRQRAWKEQDSIDGDELVVIAVRTAD